MSIFSRIFGDKSLVNTDSQIDILIKSLAPKEDEIESNKEDTSSSVLNTLFAGDKQFDTEQIFQDIAVPQERTSRYNLYDEINKTIPIVKRILKIYISNILAKNPVDGRCYLLREIAEHNAESDDNIQKSKNYIEKIIKDFDLIKKYRQKILPKKLLYGDFFIEIADINEYKIDFDKAASVITETKRFESDVAQLNNRNGGSSNLDFLSHSLSDLIMNEDYDPLLEEDESKSEDKDDFGNIVFKYHTPHNIIILETIYGSRIGYIETRKTEYLANMNLSSSLAKIVGKIVTNDQRPSEIQEKVVEKAIVFGIKKLLTNFKDKKNLTKFNTENIIKSLDTKTVMHLKRLIIEQNIDRKINNINPLSVRFIPTNRMVHFSNESADYSPYGESIIDPIILPSKLYILSQLANIITKLSRASIIRKWKLEVGASKMHSSMIQRLRRELYNTRTTLQDLGSIRSLPKILSDFKDMFILTKNGASPLDVELQSFGDASIN